MEEYDFRKHPEEDLICISIMQVLMNNPGDFSTSAIHNAITIDMGHPDKKNNRNIKVPLYQYLLPKNSNTKKLIDERITALLDNGYITQVYRHNKYKPSEKKPYFNTNKDKPFLEISFSDATAGTDLYFLNKLNSHFSLSLEELSSILTEHPGVCCEILTLKNVLIPEIMQNYKTMYFKDIIPRLKPLKTSFTAKVLETINNEFKENEYTVQMSLFTDERVSQDPTIIETDLAFAFNDFIYSDAGSLYEMTIGTGKGKGFGSQVMTKGYLDIHFPSYKMPIFSPENRQIIYLTDRSKLVADQAIDLQNQNTAKHHVLYLQGIVDHVAGLRKCKNNEYVDEDGNIAEQRLEKEKKKRKYNTPFAEELSDFLERIKYKDKIVSNEKETLGFMYTQLSKKINTYQSFDSIERKYNEDVQRINRLKDDIRALYQKIGKGIAKQILYDTRDMKCKSKKEKVWTILTSSKYKNFAELFPESMLPFSPSVCMTLQKSLNPINTFFFPRFDLKVEETAQNLILFLDESDSLRQTILDDAINSANSNPIELLEMCNCILNLVLRYQDKKDPVRRTPKLEQRLAKVIEDIEPLKCYINEIIDIDRSMRIGDKEKGYLLYQQNSAIVDTSGKIFESANSSIENQSLRICEQNDTEYDEEKVFTNDYYCIKAPNPDEDTQGEDLKNWVNKVIELSNKCLSFLKIASFGSYNYDEEDYLGKVETFAQELLKWIRRTSDNTQDTFEKRLARNVVLTKRNSKKELNDKERKNFYLNGYKLVSVNQKNKNTIGISSYILNQTPERWLYELLSNGAKVVMMSATTCIRSEFTNFALDHEMFRPFMYYPSEITKEKIRKFIKYTEEYAEHYVKDGLRINFVAPLSSQNDESIEMTDSIEKTVITDATRHVLNLREQLNVDKDESAKIINKFQNELSNLMQNDNYLHSINYYANKIIAPLFKYAQYLTDITLGKIQGRSVLGLMISEFNLEINDSTKNPPNIRKYIRNRLYTITRNVITKLIDLSSLDIVTPKFLCCNSKNINEILNEFRYFAKNKTPVLISSSYATFGKGLNVECQVDYIIYADYLHAINQRGKKLLEESIKSKKRFMVDPDFLYLNIPTDSSPKLEYNNGADELAHRAQLMTSIFHVLSIFSKGRTTYVETEQLISFLMNKERKDSYIEPNKLYRETFYESTDAAMRVIYKMVQACGRIERRPIKLMNTRVYIDSEIITKLKDVWMMGSIEESGYTEDVLNMQSITVREMLKLIDKTLDTGEIILDGITTEMPSDNEDNLKDFASIFNNIGAPQEELPVERIYTSKEKENAEWQNNGARWFMDLLRRVFSSKKQEYSVAVEEYNALYNDICKLSLSIEEFDKLVDKNGNAGMLYLSVDGVESPSYYLVSPQSQHVEGQQNSYYEAAAVVFCDKLKHGQAGFDYHSFLKRIGYENAVLKEIISSSGIDLEYEQNDVAVLSMKGVDILLGKIGEAIFDYAMKFEFPDFNSTPIEIECCERCDLLYENKDYIVAVDAKFYNNEAGIARDKSFGNEKQKKLDNKINKLKNYFKEDKRQLVYVVANTKPFICGKEDFIDNSVTVSNGVFLIRAPYLMNTEYKFDSQKILEIKIKLKRIVKKG